MSAMRIEKERRKLPAPAPETRQSVEKRLAWAAGTEQFQHRDPLYHVTENFKQSFDKMGRKHAREAAGGFSATPEGAATEEEAVERARREAAHQTERRHGNTGKPGQLLWTGNVPSALTEFSATAFQRGNLYASVLNGTGKMMLVSSLKRTVGEQGAKRLQEQTLLGTGSQIRNIPGRSPDQMAFNRTFARSALGIVVDTVRDARRTVDSMTDMALGTGELDDPGSTATMRTIYPFLDDSRERQLEAEYGEKLAKCTDPREKPILQNALIQTSELRAKKAQMKNEFISKLRFVSDRATETLAELEAPGVLDEIVSAVWTPEDTGTEEGSPPKGDSGADGADGREERIDPAELEGDAEPAGDGETAEPG